MLPRCEFGLDILAFIGEKRQQDRLSFPKIHKRLTQAHNVNISERHVPNLFRLYLALLECRSARDEVVQALMREQGRMILSGDAIRLDDVSPALYVIREVLSGEVLTAARLETASKEALVEMMAPIKEIGVPVVGTVSDKEKALLDAFESAFPEAAHQICQTHYAEPWIMPS